MPSFAPLATAPLALFISDLHLQASQPRTLAAFFTFLQRYGSKAQALYLLGDLFEYWAGDDDITDPCNHGVVKALRALSNAGVKLYWLAGNRDFLIGPAFARATGAQILSEPYIAEFTCSGSDSGNKSANQSNNEPASKAEKIRITLVHGDAECTDDVGYMAFRAKVRTPAWQQQFLSMPLSQRKTIIEGMRQGSREQQREKSMAMMDVNTNAIEALFQQTGTSLLIHGHTHRPGIHQHGQDVPHTHLGHPGPHLRHVLPDWDYDNETQPMRGGFVVLGVDGQIRHYNANGEPIEHAGTLATW
jgi:UDP-2,3-diacylglucosamine hydrolase